MSVIAEFELNYAKKGSLDKDKFSISITKPLLVEKDSDHKPTRVGFYFSNVIVHPFDQFSYTVYGANPVQAIHLASNIDFILEKLKDKDEYDFFCLSGEPYFN